MLSKLLLRCKEIWVFGFFFILVFQFRKVAYGLYVLYMKEKSKKFTCMFILASMFPDLFFVGFFVMACQPTMARLMKT